MQHTSNIPEPNPKHFIHDKYLQRLLETESKNDHETSSGETRINIHTKKLIDNPRSWEAYCLRGRVYHTKRQYLEAIYDYSAAIGLLSELKSKATSSHLPMYTSLLCEIQIARGKAYFSISEKEKALHDFDEAIKLEPNFGYIYYLRSSVHRSKGSYHDALCDLIQSLGLSESLLTDKQTDAVLKNFQDAIPGSALPLYSRIRNALKYQFDIGKIIFFDKLDTADFKKNILQKEKLSLRSQLTFLENITRPTTLEAKLLKPIISDYEQHTWEMMLDKMRNEFMKFVVFEAIPALRNYGLPDNIMLSIACIFLSIKGVKQVLITDNKLSLFHKQYYPEKYEQAANEQQWPELNEELQALKTNRSYKSRFIDALQHTANEFKNTLRGKR